MAGFTLEQNVSLCETFGLIRHQWFCCNRKYLLTELDTFYHNFSLGDWVWPGRFRNEKSLHLFCSYLLILTVRLTDAPTTLHFCKLHHLHVWQKCSNTCAMPLWDYHAWLFDRWLSLEPKSNTTSYKQVLSLQVWLHKMDLRVTSLLLALLALAEATPERYYHVPKVSKNPYPIKSQGESVLFAQKLFM